MGHFTSQHYTLSSGEVRVNSLSCVQRLYDNMFNPDILHHHGNIDKVKMHTAQVLISAYSIRA